jgi:hypothetical protein
LIFPESSTEVREGDVLSALVPRGAQDRFRTALGVVVEAHAGADAPAS